MSSIIYKLYLYYSFYFEGERSRLYGRYKNASRNIKGTRRACK